MLTVDVDEPGGNGGKLGRGGEGAVQEDPVLAAAAHGPLYYQLSFGIDPRFGQFRNHLRRPGQVEERLHLGLFLAAPDQVRGGPTAEDQVHRVDDDRLPRPGLPGQDVQPRLEGDMERVDDGDIFYGEVGEHV